LGRFVVMLKKVGVRKKTTLSMQAFRNALTNGSSLFLDKSLDQRSTFCRRYRDLIVEHTASLGGADNLSAGEMAILRRGCMLLLQLERMECEFAEHDGIVSNDTLEVYQRLVSCMRRTFESIGLQRRPKDVTTLGEYVSQAYGKGRNDGATDSDSDAA
jgi:hypothetical protein